MLLEKWTTKCEYWWIAVNQCSAAASPYPSKIQQLRVEPRPEQLIGFRSKQEQLAAQQILLDAPAEAIQTRMSEWAASEDVIVSPTQVADEPAEHTLWHIAGDELPKKDTSQYNNWKTRFDECAAIAPELKKLSLKERFLADARMINGMMKSRDYSRDQGFRELTRLGEEYLWLCAGKPYYNVHPKLVHHLCKCDLSKVPASFLEVPGGFDAALIRFCGTHEQLLVEANEYVRAVLLTRSMFGVPPEDLQQFYERGERPASLKGPAQMLQLHIDLGDRGDIEGMSYFKSWTVAIHLRPEVTLEEEFARFDSQAPESIAPGTRRREVLMNCLRLIATVGLIANSPEDNLLEYDVLSKDRQEFARANEERRAFLIERARRRGKLGWNVGTNELFLGEVAPACSASQGGKRREHSHAHIRTGHLHAVRCGPKSSCVKVKWFRPTVVRPDLPFMGG